MACAEAVRRDPGGLCATPGMESRSPEEGRSRDSGCAASWREARPWQCQSRRTGRVETPLAARTERRAGGATGRAGRQNAHGARNPATGVACAVRARSPCAQSVRAACFGGKAGRRSDRGQAPDGWRARPGPVRGAVSKGRTRRGWFIAKAVDNVPSWFLDRKS